MVGPLRSPGAFPLAVAAVVIDLDGTLLHTAPDIAAAANRALAELGRPAQAEAVIAGYIGNGVERLLKRVLTGRMDGEPEPALLAAAQAAFERHYAELCCRSQPYPDVLAGLAALQAAGYRLACVTNKTGKFTRPLLEAAGLAGYFELVLAGDSLPRKKPDPLPLMHAGAVFGVAPARMLLIGDSVNDVEAARAAGCHVFCVPYGYNHQGPVAALQADAVVSGLLEAATLIRKA